MLGVDCGCGGTHVEDVKEIGGLAITAVRKKKKKLRISYAVDNV